MIKIARFMMLMFIAVLVQADGQGNDEINGTLTAYKGNTAILQCGDGIVTLDDIVVWYHNDVPIATFVPVKNPIEAILVLDNVSHCDTGVYRCRINRMSGQSKDYVMKLSVVGLMPHSTRSCTRVHQ